MVSSKRNGSEGLPAPPANEARSAATTTVAKTYPGNSHLDESAEDNGDAAIGWEQDPDIDYTQRPTPVTDYNSDIYVSTAQNPAVFLSIIRVAQHNLPTLNLDSALNHISNLSPTDPLPQLNPDTKPWDTPFTPKPSDETLKIAFLPHFYTDERPVLAFYGLALSPADRSRRSIVTSCVVAPCTWQYLESYGLVEYKYGVQKMKMGSFVCIRNVASRHGKGLSQNTVENWAEWKAAWDIVGTVWEGRMELARGVGDDDDDYDDFENGEDEHVGEIE